MSTTMELVKFVEAVTSIQSGYLPGNAVPISGDTGLLMEGLNEVIRDTGCRIATFTFPLTAGQAEYDLRNQVIGSGFLRLIQMYVTGTSLAGRRKVHIVEDDLAEDLLEGSAGAAGTPLTATIDGGHLLTLLTPPGAGLTLKGKYASRLGQLPGDAWGGNGIDLEGYIPVEFHRAAGFWAAHLAFLLEDRPDDAQTYFDRYRVAIDKAVRQINMAKGRRVPPLRPSRTLYGAGMRSSYWDRMGL